MFRRSAPDTKIQMDDDVEGSLVLHGAQLLQRVTVAWILGLDSLPVPCCWAVVRDPHRQDSPPRGMYPSIRLTNELIGNGSCCVVLFPPILHTL
jgi:hypothetical protein